MKLGVCVLMLAAALVSGADHRPKVKVDATADDDTNFAALKTYTWTRGWSAFDRAIDRQLISEIERELEKVGLTKREAPPADVLVTYMAIQTTEVALKSKPRGNPKLYKEYAAGTLVVALLDPETRRELFRARGTTRWPEDPTMIESRIDSLVARLFEEYPTR